MDWTQQIGLLVNDSTHSFKKSGIIKMLKVHTLSKNLGS